MANPNLFGPPGGGWPQWMYDTDPSLLQRARYTSGKPMAYMTGPNAMGLPPPPLRQRSAGVQAGTQPGAWPGPWAATPWPGPLAAQAQPTSLGGYQQGQVAVRDYLGRVSFVDPMAVQGATLPWGAFQSQMAPAEVANIYNRQLLPGQPGYQSQQQGPVTHPTAPDAGAGAGAGAPKAPQYKSIPPGLAAQAAEQGFNVPENWWQEFQAKHEGETPLEYYGAQGYGDQSLGAALHDLDWSQGVMAQTGAPPTEAEWVQHWYHKQGMMTHNEYEAYKKKLAKDRKRAKDEAMPQRPPTWQPPQVWWDI